MILFTKPISCLSPQGVLDFNTVMGGRATDKNPTFTYSPYALHIFTNSTRFPSIQYCLGQMYSTARRSRVLSLNRPDVDCTRVQISLPPSTLKCYRNKDRGPSTVVQWIKLLPVILTSHIGVLLGITPALLLIQISAIATWKAADDGPSD